MNARPSAKLGAHLLLGGALLLALPGCKSPEERACANKKTVEKNHLDADAAASAPGHGEPSLDEAVATCVGALTDLRQSTQIDDAVWSAYLNCLTNAKTTSELSECLGPISESVSSSAQ